MHRTVSKESLHVLPFARFTAFTLLPCKGCVVDFVHRFPENEGPPPTSLSTTSGDCLFEARVSKAVRRPSNSSKCSNSFSL